MSDNNLPINVFHRKPFIAILICGAGLLCFWMAFTSSLSGRTCSSVFFIGPVMAVLALLFEVRTVSFHDKYLSLNYYLLRKRLIDYSTIDFVEWEYRRARSSGVGLSFNYKLIRLSLSNGKKIRLAGFKQDDDLLYEKLKGFSTDNLGMFANVFVKDHE